MTAYTRHIVRALVLMFMLTVACLNYYHSCKVKAGGQELIEESPLLSAIDWCFQKFDIDSATANLVQGNFWTLRIGKVNISDPLAWLSYALQAKKPFLLFSLTILIPLIATLLFGRFFCGWMCPAGMVFELCAKIRTQLKKWDLLAINLAFPTFFNYLVFFICAFFCFFYEIGLFAIIYPPLIFSRIVYQALYRDSMVVALYIALGLIFADIFIGDRLWCRFFCPGGTLYSLIGRRPLFKLRKDKDKCVSCLMCDNVCPYRLGPSGKINPGKCDKCLKCIASCPHRALSISTKE